MSAPVVVYENFAADSEASVACSQAMAAFPASYLTDWDAARQMRLNADAWTITHQLPYAREMDFFALLHCTNLGSTEITVKGKALATDALSTLGTISMGSSKNGHLRLSSPQMISYYEYVVAGGGSEAGGAVDPFEVVLGEVLGYGRIGQTYGGLAVDLDDVYSPGYGDNLSIPVLEAATEGGDRFVYQLGEERRALNLNWNVMTDTLRGQLNALYRAVKGQVYPFCFVDHLGALNFVRGPAARDWEQVFQTLGRGSLPLMEEPMPFDPEAS